LLESADLGVVGVGVAGAAFCARAAGATAKSQMNDESEIPIIVFMRPSQKSIIVQQPKTVKVIRAARPSR